MVFSLHLTEMTNTQTNHWKAIQTDPFHVWFMHTPCLMSALRLYIRSNQIFSPQNFRVKLRHTAAKGSTRAGVCVLSFAKPLYNNAVRWPWSSGCRIKRARAAVLQPDWTTRGGVGGARPNTTAAPLFLSALLVELPQAPRLLSLRTIPNYQLFFPSFSLVFVLKHQQICAFTPEACDDTTNGSTDPRPVFTVRRRPEARLRLNCATQLHTNPPRNKFEPRERDPDQLCVSTGNWGIDRRTRTHTRARESLILPIRESRLLASAPLMSPRCSSRGNFVQSFTFTAQRELDFTPSSSAEVRGRSFRGI